MCKESMQMISEGGVFLDRKAGPDTLALGTCAPLSVQILSFSCSFWQKCCKIIGESTYRELAPPGISNKFGFISGHIQIMWDWHEQFKWHVRWLVEIPISFPVKRFENILKQEIKPLPPSSTRRTEVVVMNHPLICDALPTLSY